MALKLGIRIERARKTGKLSKNAKAEAGRWPDAAVGERRLTWKTRIKRAKANGSFSSSEKEEVWKWPTCAVGEQVPIVRLCSGWLPDSFEASATGRTVAKLGRDFAHAVCADAVAEAERVYEEIKTLAPFCEQTPESGNREKT